jgi:hypothetical protein
MTTPTEGVNELASNNDAADLFLSRWADAEELSDTTKGDKPSRKKEEDKATVLPDDADNNDVDDEDLELEDDDEDTEADQSDDDAEDGEAPEATDDHKVVLTVDGEAKTVTVKELKRLYGQEASLTRKSQEVAQARKAAEDKGERFIVASQRMLERAEERFRPFENIDWMVAQQKLEPEEFSALREEAREALSHINFLKSEADEVVKTVRAEQQAEFVKQAKEAITILERDIPGWNRDVYRDVCTFAVDSGMDAEVVSQIVDASAIKMIHDAMKYRTLKSKALEKKTQAKANAPKRVVKPSSSNSGALGKNSEANDSLKKLAKTGRIDDAADAFLAGWREADNG